MGNVRFLHHLLRFPPGTVYYVYRSDEFSAEEDMRFKLSRLRTSDQLPLQPQASGHPIPRNRSRRDGQRSGSFLNGKTGKEAQLHNARLSFIEPRKFVQGIVEGDHVKVLFGRKLGGFVQPNDISSSTLGSLS